MYYGSHFFWHISPISQYVFQCLFDEFYKNNNLFNKYN